MTRETKQLLSAITTFRGLKGVLALIWHSHLHKNAISDRRGLTGPSSRLRLWGKGRVGGW